MTVSLGGITLDDNLALPGIKNRSRVAVSNRLTILGRPVIQTAPVEGGQVLILEALQSGRYFSGKYTGAQVDQIKALEAAATAVTLVHHQGTFSVIIAETSFQQVIDYVNPTDDDIYVGTITMYEV